MHINHGWYFAKKTVSVLVFEKTAKNCSQFLSILQKNTAVFW